jgi:hypothetical protein
MLNIFIFTTVLVQTTNDDDNEAAMSAHRILMGQAPSGVEPGVSRPAEPGCAMRRGTGISLRRSDRDTAFASSPPSFVLRVGNPGAFHPSAPGGMMTPDDITVPGNECTDSGKQVEIEGDTIPRAMTLARGPRESQAEFSRDQIAARAARGDAR